MKPSALKRGHPTLQNMNFSKKFLLLWVIFALLDTDPDSEYGSGSTDPIESGSNPDPIRIRIRNPAINSIQYGANAGYILWIFYPNPGFWRPKL